jgi:hypothetical protein
VDSTTNCEIKMSTITDDNAPPSSRPLDDAAAGMANGIESGAEEETEAPPEQPPGDEDNPHVPHALD